MMREGTKIVCSAPTYRANGENPPLLPLFEDHEQPACHAFGRSPVFKIEVVG